MFLFFIVNVPRGERERGEREGEGREREGGGGERGEGLLKYMYMYGSLLPAGVMHYMTTPTGIDAPLCI